MRLRPYLPALTLIATALSTTLPAAGRSVSFRTYDGRTVTALLFETNQRPAPAIVLVPMLGRPKEDWQALGDRLAEANIMALAVDLPDRAAPGSPVELAAWHTVIGGAVDYLFSRSDVRGGSLGVIGASLGANLAAVAAASDSRVRSLALISPSLDYRGVRIEGALKQYGERPALLVASRHDPYAARSVRQLAEDSSGPRDVQWSETAAHGTVLLARDPDLPRLILEWFQRTLG